MILDNQDSVERLSWNVDLLCTQVDVLEAENATLCEEVQVLRGRDEELAMRLQRLEERVVARVCPCAGGSGEMEAVVDRAESSYTFGDGMAVDVAGEYVDDIVLSSRARSEVRGQCAVRGHRRRLTRAQLIVISSDEESG